ncbi:MULTISPECIES: TIGR02117 family protein [unclassified Calothrix]|uniref:TIGR02117 family protein n=1 Tax=unclassified Calothrix TaxID=2619626 RepID=UPI001F54BCC0|nr:MULTISPECIES: TIGR02117 family protein [unclassified Calothrix]
MFLYPDIMIVMKFTCNLLRQRFLYCRRYFFRGCLFSLALLTLGVLIPRKWSYQQQDNCNLDVCISNTGIHSNIILPTKNYAFDWHEYISVEGIGIDNFNDYNYLSFGWGDRAFYMSTPSMADLQLSTTFKALFLPTPSVLYVKGYQLIPDNLEVKCIKVNKNNYLQLIKFIQATFKVDDRGRVIRIGNGHTTNAGFYDAFGSYSILRNCNNWTTEALRQADVNTPLWGGLSAAIMLQLRSGCETR